MAVGIVNNVFKVDARARRRTDAQYLVGADAKMAVAQKPVLRGRQGKPLAGLVEHHKIVARALHFGKADSHAGIIR